MDQINAQEKILRHVALLEGDGFVYDDKAILEEYERLLHTQSNLAIKVLTIAGGILATLSFLGFWALAGFFNSNLWLVIFGISFVVLAIGLSKKTNALFFDTLCISCYSVGLSLLAFGLLEWNVNETIVALSISSIALCSLLISQKYMLSFISVLVVFGSLLLVILSNNAYALVHLYIALTAAILVFVFLHESKLISWNKKLSQLYAPLRIGLVFSLLFGLIAVGKRNLIPVSPYSMCISSVALMAIGFYLIHRILSVLEIKEKSKQLSIYLLAACILATCVFSPSIIGAILIILISFFVNYKTTFAIGILALIYFVCQYYYDLDFTLLTKSIIMLASGALFFILYLFTKKRS